MLYWIRQFAYAIFGFKVGRNATARARARRAKHPLWADIWTAIKAVLVITLVYWLFFRGGTHTVFTWLDSAMH